MDQDKEIICEGMPLFRIYKDLKIERFNIIDLSPPSFDSSTKVSSKDIEIIPEINLSARLYLPMLQNRSPKKLPVMIHYHGGGFVVGSAAMSPLHNYLNALVAKANVILVSVNYRLATEHMVPVAYEDSWLALQWVASHAVSETDNYCRDSWLVDHADFTRVYLSGESAGANIAHNLAMLAYFIPPYYRFFFIYFISSMASKYSTCTCFAIITIMIFIRSTSTDARLLMADKIENIALQVEVQALAT